jgi:hypothetical protein
MSSRIRFVHASLFALSLSATGACVDPQKTFDEFAERVPDAAPRDCVAGEGLCDLSGSFLASIQTPLGDPLRFLATIEFTPNEGGGTADVTLQAITAARCDKENPGEPAGEPVTIPDVPIDGDGAFTILAAGAMTDGAANPITCSPIVADIELCGRTQAADSDCILCGDVSGQVLQPIMTDLSGTFGSAKVAELGEDPPTGDANLPDVVTECPAE